MDLQLEDLRSLIGELKPTAIHSRSEWLTRPWRVREFIGVTDAHGFLVFRSNATVDLAPNDNQRIIGKHLDIVLSPILYDLKHLASFSVRPLPPCHKCNDAKAQTCNQCNGTRTMECECSKCGDEHDTGCDQCDGKGTIECACEYQIKASMFGRTINLVLLGKFIKYAPGNTFRIGETSGPYEALIIGMDDWRIAIMPMHADATENYIPQEAE